MTNKALAALLVAALIAAPVSSGLAGDDHNHAHNKEHADDKDHDHSNHKHGASHGGQYVETDDHHGVEMVSTDATIVFHLSENHEPLDLTGTKFKAVVQTGEGTSMMALTPEGSTLKGPLAGPLPKGAKVVLTGKDSHGDAIQARFVKE